MRGKLRDKNSTNKRDTFRRGAEGEIRRPYKRDTRTAHWIDQQVEDNDDNYEEDEELEEETEEVELNPIMKVTAKK
ncbi:hypothetical protein [Dictyobacter kobayashii]|uniref:Uncharacterized protein n=1 Tax=Dictyobacter kobayashii TaxID=2014872 RepID=A0A402AN35_9CHLR|nr:hypothetical protein [Dictyobacter kobayashii]GCE20425.1 hypothetical protein KDK_42250 [Dictyobacter kobayashii]